MSSCDQVASQSDWIAFSARHDLEKVTVDGRASCMDVMTNDLRLVQFLEQLKSDKRLQHESATAPSALAQATNGIMVFKISIQLPSPYPIDGDKKSH